MFALRFTPLFLFATSFVTGTSVVEKRSITADVESSVGTILDTLQSSVDSILPQIAAVTAAGNATDATVTPLINDLTTTLNTAATSLVNLLPDSLTKRQSEADIASLLAGIVTNMVEALEPLLVYALEIPDLGSLLSGIDTALSQVLSNISMILSGILDASKPHFVQLAGILGLLGFDDTLSLLGL